MKKQTIAVDTPFVRPDVYGALAVPIYNNVAFEFDEKRGKRIYLINLKMMIYICR